VIADPGSLPVLEAERQDSHSKAQYLTERQDFPRPARQWQLTYRSGSRHSHDHPRPLDPGAAIRAARRRRGLTQRDLALIAGTGERFIVDLEAGKATAQLGRTLAVIAALGLRLSLADPRHDDGTAP